eukprot:gnl/TRDRNA2_/TRDRNA2_181740_c0_seq1.p1 gnl/TRDRNA2_/TRDRNA2_181740_c0~~gnl/TRDRNA2_/TRDRNA2_181740_c0_seq1.p1  ORF type:complete len:170 (+),score=33.97 gnl/TRDRNA2_/TRDRNA2_181740_c0_seq1:71-580(+)
MSGIPQIVQWEGKEITMFTFKQLEPMGNKALRDRAMNMRDAVGQEQLPPMPRQHETIVKWILDVQCALVRETMGMNLTPLDFGMPATLMGGAVAGPVGDPRPSRAGSAVSQQYAAAGAAGAGYGGGSPYGQKMPDEGSEYGGSEAGQAYDEAKRTRLQAIKRNQGSGIF